MALATFGVVVPAVAAVYEFVIKGRKRLGYRVQMDTTVTDVVQSEHAGPLRELRQGGDPLAKPTLVLLRIENNGATFIDTHDYAVLDDSRVGLRVRFPGRRVAGMVVTELSDDYLRDSFTNGDGFAADGDLIELPRTPMNRSAHYKVLAALERADGSAGATFDPPEVIGGIKGGRIVETQSRTGTPKRAIALVGFLVVLVVAQLLVFLRSNTTAPLDCATGRLQVVGSTAFAPIVREAADSYRKLCPGAEFAIDMRGSGEGLQALQQADAGVLAFSDGEKPDGMPALLPRPIAFFLFTLVAHPDTGVHDLSPEQIRRIYRGELTNWREIGGNDLPIRLVSRNPGSGTRAALQRRVLNGVREPGSNSDDCHTPDPGAEPGVLRCARNSTQEVLRTVADTPGALGYAELGAGEGQDGLTLVRIGGHRATVSEADHGTYPFWETEYGYTHGEPDARSLTASFLRYLTNQVGADIIRANGDRPCADLANPAICRPA
ncbi:PstS family phosphate ABC transporter substrate-binding protein [Paractinoplanes brasiliensis]|uniref:Phosphate ABC transporter substrate-binding protein (PhoT family) n=1 Tax=Paractinoplanes brasiliensis TaxID=52695 RepID=A0A4R6JKX2_9ACTN|nr:substrate-binding domain-containing protein [Actinoplanes brasiliensis]TDO36924.1 phosphate ABC transporter substrate-binding protein (PhoT family) [Actinoplanes brasiliensis]GID30446.1 phosphate-binding protein [Actinoplanes brasiliensis]